MRKPLLAFVTILALLAAPWVADAQLPVNSVQGAKLQAAAAATGNGTTLDTSGATAVTFQTSGTFSATVTFEGSNDGTNFNSLTCYTLDSQTSTSTATAAGFVRCNVLGIPTVRARVSTYSSGSVTVVANASAGAFPSVRDTTAPAGAITGQLRGTQVTAPTCDQVNGVGAARGVAGSCGPGGAVGVGPSASAGGTDSFFRGVIGTTWQGGGQGNPGAIIVTFANSFAAVPTCVASYDSAGKYGYYLYAVTPTTTTVTLKLGTPTSVLTPAVASWSPFDNFNLICGGVQ
jgi:hypothetical protein